MLPNRYPLTLDVDAYIADEQRLGRLLDYAVIVPRLQPLYEWSAEVLGEPRLLELVRDGSPIYAWPYAERHVWRSPHMPLAGRLLEPITRTRWVHRRLTGANKTGTAATVAGGVRR